MARESANDDFLSKLDSLNTLSKRRDFNPEVLNRFFIKSIKIFYQSLYGEEDPELEKYLSEDFCIKTIDNICESLRIYRFSNVSIAINSIDLVEQSVEGINFVSSLTLKIKLTLFYHREFIPNGIVREFNEVLEDELYYKNEDTGWKIKKIKKSNILESTDRIIDVK